MWAERRWVVLIIRMVRILLHLFYVHLKPSHNWELRGVPSWAQLHFVHDSTCVRHLVDTLLANHTMICCITHQRYDRSIWEEKKKYFWFVNTIWIKKTLQPLQHYCPYSRWSSVESMSSQQNHIRMANPATNQINQLLFVVE